MKERVEPMQVKRKDLCVWTCLFACSMDADHARKN